MVKFVSYDGKYPNLCSGTLILSIDGEIVECYMRSGGTVWFDNEWNEHIECGKWSVDVPEKYEYMRNEIEDCVNSNVEWGCCGGCV